jgi:hypothetical protein
MSKTTVDLTISVVEAEADTLLRDYPFYPYQRAFSAPSLRQKLIAYVLCRIPNLYALIEQQVSACEALCCPPAQQKQVETLIHRGIQYLLLESLPQVTIESEVYEDLDEMNVGTPSSHWFR